MSSTGRRLLYRTPADVRAIASSPRTREDSGMHEGSRPGMYRDGRDIFAGLVLGVVLTGIPWFVGVYVIAQMVWRWA